MALAKALGLAKLFESDKSGWLAVRLTLRDKVERMADVQAAVQQQRAGRRAGTSVPLVAYFATKMPTDPTLFESISGASVMAAVQAFTKAAQLSSTSTQAAVDSARQVGEETGMRR